MTLDFKINGVVYVKETKHPIPNVIVRAYDKDLLFDDLLGDTTTDNFGRFELQYSEIDFKDLFEKQPDIYFRIFDPSGKKLIHLSVDSVRWNAEAEEYFEIPIPKYKIPILKEEHYLIDSQGVIRTEFEPSDSKINWFIVI